MINLKKVRRQRKALELICNKLDITDKVLNDFIDQSKPKVEKPAPKPNAKEIIKLIESCNTMDELNEFEGDSRASVIKAYISKKDELNSNEG